MAKILPIHFVCRARFQATECKMGGHCRNHQKRKIPKTIIQKLFKNVWAFLGMSHFVNEILGPGQITVGYVTLDS